MNKFSQAFQAAQEYVQTGDLSKSSLTNAEVVRIKSLLSQADGPTATDAVILDTLRDRISKAASKEMLNGVPPNNAAAAALINLMSSSTDINSGLATLKMLKHLYCVSTTGGQNVWVYSPPKAYFKWIFDELATASSNQLVNILALPEEEVFSNHQKEVMGAAIKQTQSMAMDVVAKLGAPNDATTAVVKRYFGDASTTPASLLATMGTLRAGYQKIAGLCNSSKVILSDEPGNRNGPGWVNWAFIYTFEEMTVIYMQNAWLNKANEVSPSNQPPLYRCARTIIHELSHKAVSTEDIAYGQMGLKPAITAPLSAEYALHNADSWAYFAVDVLGLLTGPDLRNGEKVNTRILKVPSRTLTV